MRKHEFEMNFLAATHSKDLEYCYASSLLIEAFLLQPFRPLCESIHTTEAYRIFLSTLRTRARAGESNQCWYPECLQKSHL